MDEINLNLINSLRTAFEVEVGYSDHTMGIEVPIAAVTLGATVIEKHFTLDRTMVGPDHTRQALNLMNLRKWYLVFVILN